MPGLVKIGYSARDATKRVREINAATGVPAPYNLEFEVYVEDPEGHEKRIHQILEKCRLQPRKEFFQCSVDEAIASVKRAVGDGPLEETTFLAKFEKPTLARQQLNNKKNLPRRAYARWNINEIEYLKKCIEKGVSPVELSAKLERKTSSIEAQIERHFENREPQYGWRNKRKRSQLRMNDEILVLMNDYIVIANNLIQKVDLETVTPKLKKKKKALKAMVTFASEKKDNLTSKRALKLVRMLDCMIKDLATTEK